MKLLVLLLLVSLGVQAQDSYTIYLVRHAEKAVSESNPRDPGLTPCGQQRSQSIAHFLARIEVDVVYSTDYVRTRDTAAPVAKAKSLEIVSYNPRDLNGFAEKLMELKQNAVVVGHSNTTGVLAGILVDQEIKEVSMSEDVYDRIYQVAIAGESRSLNVFQSAFECDQ